MPPQGSELVFEFEQKVHVGLECASVGAPDKWEVAYEFSGQVVKGPDDRPRGTYVLPDESLPPDEEYNTGHPQLFTGEIFKNVIRGREMFYRFVVRVATEASDTDAAIISLTKSA